MGWHSNSHPSLVPHDRLYHLYLHRHLPQTQRSHQPHLQPFQLNSSGPRYTRNCGSTSTASEWVGFGGTVCSDAQRRRYTRCNSQINPASKIFYIQIKSTLMRFLRRTLVGPVLVVEVGATPDLLLFTCRGHLTGSKTIPTSSLPYRNSLLFKYSSTTTTSTTTVLQSRGQCPLVQFGQTLPPPFMLSLRDDQLLAL